MTGLPAGPGLTDMLADGMPATEAGQHLAGAPRLRVIMPGSAAGADSGDLPLHAVRRLVAELNLPLHAVQRLVAELSGTARWIILEAPPAGRHTRHDSSAAHRGASDSRHDRLYHGIGHIARHCDRSMGKSAYDVT